MITIQSGKMKIPERERFIGFAGDNITSQKQFVILDISDDTFIYRLYLTFDDGTCNYFLLDKEVGESSTTLTWNVKEEHIFKSGAVKAQIKAISSDGEIYHTNSDCFIVLPSAEFEEYFANKENSEFLHYERFLNTLLDNIEITQQSLPYIGDNGYWYVYDSSLGRYVKTEFTACCDDEKHIIKVDSEMSDTSNNPIKNKAVKSYVDSTQLNLVPNTRTIASLSLESDIAPQDLRSAMNVRPNFEGAGTPEEKPIYQTGDVYFRTSTSDYYVFNGNNPSGSKWVKINGTGGGGTEYFSGDGIDITDNTISVDNTVAKVNDVVPKTRTIANLNLSSDIPARSLCSALGVDSKLDTENIDTGINNPESDSYVLSEKALVNCFAMFTHGSIIPNENTEGYKGEYRWSFVGNRLFVCVGKNGDNFIWKEIPTNEYIVNLINTCFLKTDVASTFSTDEGKVYSTSYINSLVGNIGQIQQEVDDLVGE